MTRTIRLILPLSVVAAALIHGGCTSPAVTGDSPPRVVFQAPPQYPSEMRHLGQSGKVVVEFIVDTEGVPRDFRVISSTDKAFEEPAIAAVARWRFKPGIKDGRPVNCRMTVPIGFDIVP